MTVQVHRQEQAPTRRTAKFRPGQKYVGEVKWFRNDLGYGFLTKTGDVDVFVYYSDIVGEGYKTLLEGDRVEYQIEDGERGVKAVKVRVL